MKIVALIKQILDPNGVVVRRDKERVFVNKKVYVIAPGDKNGLEAALQIKDALPDSNVTAVSLGSLQADDALREALAMGADAAYLLHDEAFHKMDLSGVARILAAAVSRLDPDLIITGRESGSDAAGQIGPRIAEILDVAQITDVYSMSVSDGAVTAVRCWEDRHATVKAALPIVITVAPDINRPRYPHGARIMNACRDWEVPIWGAADLGLDTDLLTPLIEFRGESFAPPLIVGERLRGEPEQIVGVLLSEMKAVISNLSN
jgi:electron transfer flavoprotein beta subunit